MGVAMAWPTSRYHADDVVLARLSDTRTWPQSARTFGRRPLPRREPGFGSRRGSYSGGGGGDGLVNVEGAVAQVPASRVIAVASVGLGTLLLAGVQFLH